MLAGFGVEAKNDGLVDFGVAYYPEAWPEERWDVDLAMMEELGINLVRMGEFNWSRFEPEEGKFDFAPYLRVLDLCRKHGISVMMCTPTAAAPKWMQKDFPETEKTRADGTKVPCGIRQSSCATNPKFRFFSRRITEKMAEAFKDHPAVTTWQIDNELHIWGATGTCVCDACQTAYREDLKRRYGTIENLNREFNGAFWSSVFTKWEDVRLPFTHIRFGWTRDYLRFQGEQFLSYALEQAAILRKANPKWRITSNNPSASNFIRHDHLFKNLGYAAADTYLSGIALNRLHINFWTWGMFRGLTGTQKPFMVAETGPFSFDAMANESYDLVKPWFWLAVAHGAESYVYFRWRESVSGEETHPAILPWSGRRTFVYDMIKRQMEEFRSLPDSIARLPLPKAEVAIVHDADSHIFSLAYATGLKRQDDSQTTGRDLIAAIEGRGVWADFVQLSDDMDLSRYKVVFFPQCYSLSQTQRTKIRAYTEAGGAAVAVNRMNFCSPLGGYYYPEPCPVGMLDLFGVEIDERRSLPVGNVELAKVVDAEVVMRLDDTCFKGHPLLTRRVAGKGAAYYYTRVPDLAMARALVAAVLGREGVAMREQLPDGVSRTVRGNYAIVVNFSDKEADIPAEKGEFLLGRPVVSEGRMQVKPFDVVVCRLK